MEHILEFPTSIILALVFMLIPIALHRFAGNSAVVRTLGSVRMARILLAVGAVMLAVEGTWSVPLHQSYAFIGYVLVMLLSLGLVVVNGIKKKLKVGFLLNHLGIFLIIWGALFGSSDVKRSKMVVNKDYAENFSYADDGLVVQLPFSVKLKEFTVDYYPDGVSPRQFTSKIIVDGKEMSVAVNEPVSYDGYTLFQESYDREFGQYTVLQVVRDPWLPVIYVGMLLLALGSIMLLFGRWKVKLVVPVTLLLTVAFTALTVAKINFGTLMPALRSWWFVPHLFIYMVAYSLMAFALIMWIAAEMKKKDQWRELSNNLMRSSSALLIIGILTGSVWARQAWGDYWAWDPKENWAAVTWFLSLMHLHLQDKRGWKSLAILILSFLALQITWYGVNYLPSAMNSMHTYTK